jgi:hypothetical protein
MPSRDAVEKLLQNHHRRLQKLEERKALYGLETPIAILTEIEDTRAEIENLQTQLNKLEHRVDNLENGAVITDAGQQPIKSEAAGGYLIWVWIGTGLLALSIVAGLVAFFVGRSSPDDNQNKNSTSQVTSSTSITPIPPTVPPTNTPTATVTPTPTTPPTNTPIYKIKFWVSVQSTDWENLNEAAYFKGGQEDAFGVKRDLYLCRAKHEGAMIPGKVVANHCNIAIGNDLDGSEEAKSSFEVFQGEALLQWEPVSDEVLKHFYEIGEEFNIKLGACRVVYQGGIHPGKLLNDKCFISYDHSVLQPSEDTYDVLVEK